MLETPRTDQRVSTGLSALDEVLEGLFWGDNVVWQMDGAAVTPFYEAIARLEESFESRTYVRIGDEPPVMDAAGLDTLRVGAGTSLAPPANLLRAGHRNCRPVGR